MRGVTRRVVNAYNSHTDGFWSASAKRGALRFEHIYHTHDLLDHRLSNDLHFHTDLDVCDVTSCHLETSIVDSFALRHALTKRAIPSPCLDALGQIA